MLRVDIEKLMTTNKINHIAIVINETDKLGIYCELKGGILYDYTGHRVDRKKDIWGYLKFENGKPIRVKW